MLKAIMPAVAGSMRKKISRMPIEKDDFIPDTSPVDAILEIEGKSTVETATAKIPSGKYHIRIA
jgi:hypothetical protein